jgi:hypothetical protein
MVKLLGYEHKPLKKNFVTSVTVDGRDLPLNHFMQETLANLMVGFMKALKDSDECPKKIEIKIKKLEKETVVDAHTYPTVTKGD